MPSGNARPSILSSATRDLSGLSSAATGGDGGRVLRLAGPRKTLPVTLPGLVDQVNAELKFASDGPAVAAGSFPGMTGTVRRRISWLEPPAHESQARRRRELIGTTSASHGGLKGGKARRQNRVGLFHPSQSSTAPSMAAPSLPPVSELLQQVQRETARCQQELDAVKSPAAEYDEQTAIIKSRIERCWKKYDDRSLANPVEIQADIINHSRSLERLKFSYEASLADAEAAYARQVGEVWETYCHGLLDVLQPCLSRQTIQRLYESSKRSSRSGGVPGRESATASGGVSSPDGVRVFHLPSCSPSY